MHAAAARLYLHSNIIRMLTLLGQRQTEIIHRQSSVDRENPQRLAAGIEILVPLKHRDRENVQGVEVKFFVFDDNFAFAADDKIDFVIEMAMRARALSRREFPPSPHREPCYESRCAGRPHRPDCPLPSARRPRSFCFTNTLLARRSCSSCMANATCSAYISAARLLVRLTVVELARRRRESTSCAHLRLLERKPKIPDSARPRKPPGPAPTTADRWWTRCAIPAHRRR